MKRILALLTVLCTIIVLPAQTPDFSNLISYQVADNNHVSADTLIQQTVTALQTTLQAASNEDFICLIAATANSDTLNGITAIALTTPAPNCCNSYSTSKRIAPGLKVCAFVSPAYPALQDAQNYIGFNLNAFLLCNPANSLAGVQWLIFKDIASSGVTWQAALIMVYSGNAPGSNAILP